MWMVADQEGDKIYKIPRDTLVAKSDMTNLNMVTGEITFPEGVKYPQVYTLCCLT